MVGVVCVITWSALLCVFALIIMALADGVRGWSTGCGRLVDRMRQISSAFRHLSWLDIGRRASIQLGL